MAWESLSLTQAMAACVAETRPFLIEHGASVADVPDNPEPGRPPVVLAGGTAASRSALAAALQPSDVTLVDPPFVDVRIGGAVLLGELDRAAGVLFVVDEVPLPDPDLELLLRMLQATRRAVFVVGDRSDGLRDLLADRAVRFAKAPFVGRTDRAGLRDALTIVAESAHLHRRADVLRSMRSAAVWLDVLLRERLGAVRRDEARLTEIREQLAAVDARKPAPPFVRPDLADRTAPRFDAFRRWFDDAPRSDEDVAVALVELAALCSRDLAFAVGRARRAVRAAFGPFEAAAVEPWVTARVCELYNGGEPRRPLHRWTIDTSGPPLLPIDGFELGTYAARWHPDRAQAWLGEVLDGAQAEVTDRAARLDAAIGQALAEANDRWRRRLLHQLAETHALHGDPAGRERRAAWLAAESDAVRDCVRRLDTVLVRSRRSILDDPEVSG